jgi:hypothetical protein
LLALLVLAASDGLTSALFSTGAAVSFFGCAAIRTQLPALAKNSSPTSGFIQKATPTEMANRPTATTLMAMYLAMVLDLLGRGFLFAVLVAVAEVAELAELGLAVAAKGGDFLTTDLVRRLKKSTAASSWPLFRAC